MGKSRTKFYHELKQETFIQRAQAALAFSGSQLRHLITQHPDYFPLYTVKGKWKHDSEAWTNWCEGFLGGMLWIMYRHTGMLGGRNGPSIIRG